MQKDNLVGTDDFRLDLTRQKFEELIQPVVDKCLAEVEKVLQDARVDKTQVSQIIMVGGSSRIPAIQQQLTNYFDGRVVLNTEVNPDEVVAIGACLMAAKLKSVPGIDIPTTQDVAPLSVGYAAKHEIDLPWYKRLFCSR